MSGTTGATSTYIKNQNVKESQLTNTGFKKIRFLHQATAGDTLIQLGSLVAPTGAVNYSAPSATELSQTNMMQWTGNVELVSSVAGRLIQNISYVISGASTIKLLYSARDGEIFEGVIDYGARTGLTLVDAAPIVASGTLAAGSTDFNVGTPFQVGLYSSMQVGAVMVFSDKALMTRNTGNNAPGSGVDGDYYEVNAGGGLGTVIRFNVADLTNDRQISVISVNGLVERPNGSFMAVMEALQGQLDAIVPTLAALADVSETAFQATPNNVDLKSFGDRVFTLEKIYTLQVPVTTAWASFTPVFTGVGTATNIEFWWRQRGQNYEISGRYTWGTVTATPPGISLPNSASVGTTVSASNHLLGQAASTNVNAGYYTVYTQASATQIFIGVSNAAIAGLTSTNASAFGGAGGSGTTFSFTVSVPIANLNSTQSVKQALGL